MQIKFKIHFILILLNYFILINYISAKPHHHHKHSSLSKDEKWGKLNKCPIDSFVTGISLKLRINSSTITSIRFYCTRQHVVSERNNDFIDTVIQVDPIDQPEALLSHWTKPIFCESGVATDFRIKYENKTTSNVNVHQTVTNIKLICSDGQHLKIHGHGKDKGNWTEGSICSPRHAICGLQTSQVVSGIEHVGNILTDARVHCCDVKNPATKCIPSDRWQHVADCENSKAIVPETCSFEKKIGLSYAGKEKETSVYENLGFTLNGVSTDLSNKIEFTEAVSDATGFSWGTTTQQTWLPETKTKDTIVAQPGMKTTVYQVVGHCGFYRIRTSKFRIDTNIVESSSLKHLSVVPDKKDVLPVSHVKNHHDHEKKTSFKHHDNNIQADFGDDDDEWGNDDWEEQVDETGKHDNGEMDLNQENKDEKKKSDEKFGDEWDTDKKTETKVVLPGFALPKSSAVDKANIKQDSNESFEDDDWDNSDENKPETKIIQPDPVLLNKEKVDSVEKKETKDSFEDDWGSVEEEKKAEDKIESPIPTILTVPAKPDEKQNLNEEEISHDSFENDGWDNSEEKKHDVEVDSPTTDAVPVPAKPEEKQNLNEEESSQDSFENDGWDNSEEKKHDVEVDVPTTAAVPVQAKPEETHGSHDSFSNENWNNSEENKHDTEDKHPVVSASDVQTHEDHHGSNDSFEDDDFGNSEEKKDEAGEIIPSPVGSAQTKNTDVKIESNEYEGNDLIKTEEEKTQTKVDIAVAPTSHSQSDEGETKGVPGADNVLVHEPISTFSKDDTESVDSLNEDTWGNSEEDTHEAKVMNSLNSASAHSEQKTELKKESKEVVEDNSGENKIMIATNKSKDVSEHKSELTNQDDVNIRHFYLENHKVAPEADVTVDKSEESKSNTKAEENENDSKVFQNKPHSEINDMELMAKDKASDEWDSFEHDDLAKNESPVEIKVHDEETNPEEMVLHEHKHEDEIKVHDEETNPEEMVLHEHKHEDEIKVHDEETNSEEMVLHEHKHEDEIKVHDEETNPEEMVLHEHKHEDSPETETLSNSNNMNSPVLKENIKMTEPSLVAPVANDDEWDSDWGMSIDLPDTKKYNQMSKQVDNNDSIDNHDHDNSNSMGKFDSALKSTQDEMHTFHRDNIAPLEDKIISGIDDLSKTIKDVKDIPIIKETSKTISEMLDSVQNPQHGAEHTHQDDEPIIVKDDSDNNSVSPISNESQGEPPKVQSAILGYIVGGMVAGVVIIVIIIFVLERRKPKRYPDENDKNIDGPTKDPPLLQGYKKDVALAVGSDKDAF